MFLYKQKLSSLDVRDILRYFGSTLAILSVIGFFIHAFVAINAIWSIYIIPGDKIVTTTIILQILFSIVGFPLYSLNSD